MSKVILTRVSGSVKKSMEQAFLSGEVETDMKEIGSKTLGTEKVCLNGQMATVLREIS